MNRQRQIHPPGTNINLLQDANLTYFIPIKGTQIHTNYSCTLFCYSPMQCQKHSKAAVKRGIDKLEYSYLFATVTGTVTLI